MTGKRQGGPIMHVVDGAKIGKPGSSTSRTKPISAALLSTEDAVELIRDLAVPGMAEIKQRELARMLDAMDTALTAAEESVAQEVRRFLTERADSND
ncbi:MULTISPECIES: hypothetical protein [unclassified Crossiella]|uniref:hypothetical protein n=1 Tax=unclassified Crossiella TaxID=2620835 RepID=UPI0020002789|nr:MULTISPECIES: hypothetical protein [unclassified Crossiella]MCK2240669.1 hypothetical protein [Crossiella sp. S99.2]MCK2252880.1 hypothetical protein [Crossiella sp. S99.1]